MVSGPILASSSCSKARSITKRCLLAILPSYLVQDSLSRRPVSCMSRPFIVQDRDKHVQQSRGFAELLETARGGLTLLVHYRLIVVLGSWSSITEMRCKRLIRYDGEDRLLRFLSSNGVILFK
jgi:hypothetical protein